MRILFFTSSEADYLSDGLLLGFRQIFGADVVDYPRCDILYRDCPGPIQKQVRGHGFTLYTGLLDNISVDRYQVETNLSHGAYDLIIISDIWRQFGFFAQWRPYLHPGNTIIIDGTDTPQVYPHAGHWWRRPYFWFLPRVTAGFLYFKRELTRESRFNLWSRVLPGFCLEWLPPYHGVRRISFGFPAEKIVVSPPNKTKDFARHIVDAELAALVPGSVTSYAFTSESEYYADLKTARFGITTRRAGWDCLRHYEIAANGAVPCFRDLQDKPAECAPHGLVPGKNCLSYREAGDLLLQIKRLTPSGYALLQQGAIEWVRTKSTHAIASEVIAEWHRSRPRDLSQWPNERGAIASDNEFESTTV